MPVLPSYRNQSIDLQRATLAFNGLNRSSHFSVCKTTKLYKNGMFRSSRPDVFCQKGILKNFSQNSQENSRATVSFLNKIAGATKSCKQPSSYFFLGFKIYQDKKIVAKPSGLL